MFFSADDPDTLVVGKIVGIGLADEMKDRHYVLVDGIDGKLNYAETVRGHRRPGRVRRGQAVRSG
ncbi:MAG: DUF3363 domain-containing protein [Hyphomicrobiales bacterium]|nr:DUF3363 domain-containing protein [Hyphomicrobiales bacterium]